MLCKSVVFAASLVALVSSQALPPPEDGPSEVPPPPPPVPGTQQVTLTLRTSQCKWARSPDNLDLFLTSENQKQSLMPAPVPPLTEKVPVSGLETGEVKSFPMRMVQGATHFRLCSHSSNVWYGLVEVQLAGETAPYLEAPPPTHEAEDGPCVGHPFGQRDADDARFQGTGEEIVDCVQFAMVQAAGGARLLRATRVNLATATEAAAVTLRTSDCKWARSPKDLQLFLTSENRRDGLPSLTEQLPVSGLETGEVKTMPVRLAAHATHVTLCSHSANVWYGLLEVHRDGEAAPYLEVPPPTHEAEDSDAPCVGHPYGQRSRDDARFVPTDELIVDCVKFKLIDDGPSKILRGRRINIDTV